MLRQIKEERVSIHAPARGATAADKRYTLLAWGFNPRAREGRDRLCSFLSAAIHDVSIHAPARGATLLIDELNQLTKVSIHAPARGATQAARPAGMPPGVSIHAPARGATIAFISSAAL